MTHETRESDEYILLPTDLEEVSEPIDVRAHVRQEQSLLFQPAQLREASTADSPEPVAPGSGVLSLPQLGSFSADAGGLPSLLVMPPPRAPASAPSRSLIAAVLVASLAMVSAVALAAHSAARPAAAPVARAETPEPPRTTIAPLAERPQLSIPSFDLEPEVEPEVEPVEIAEPPAPVITTTSPRRPVARPTRTPTPTPPRTAVAATPSCGDEVECLLADDSDTPFEPSTEPEPDPRRPESLDSFAISRAMDSATRGAARCDDEYGSGIVKVRVTVGSDGRADKVLITSTPSQPLAACVADAIRATSFPETRTGATFNYIFPFR